MAVAGPEQEGSAIRAFLRLVRLPLDLVVITVQFLRVTAWLMQSAFRRALGFRHYLHGPCSKERLDATDRDGRPVQICLCAERLGSPFLMHLLCPWLQLRRDTEGALACVCRRRSYFRVNPFRYIVVAVLLVGLWYGVARLVRAGVQSGGWGQTGRDLFEDGSQAH